MNRSGQILIEFNLVTLLITLPLVVGGAAWAKLEWNREKCAYESFFKARKELIRTHQAVHYQQTCGSIHETIDLKPLQDLDQGSSGLSIGDALNEASRLWDSASHSSSSLQESD